MPDRQILDSHAPHPTAGEPTGERRSRAAPASGAPPRQDLQTHVLTGLLNQAVTVYLVNGIRLSGTLRQFDSFTVLLHDANDSGTLIFKHAISTLLPGAPATPSPRRTPFGKLAEWNR